MKCSIELYRLYMIMYDTKRKPIDQHKYFIKDDAMAEGQYKG